MVISTILIVAALGNKIEMASSLQKVSSFLIVDEVTDVISLVAKITLPSDYTLKLLVKGVCAYFLLLRCSIDSLARVFLSHPPPPPFGHTRENKIYHRVIPDSRHAFSARRERGNLC